MVRLRHTIALMLLAAPRAFSEPMPRLPPTSPASPPSRDKLVDFGTQIPGVARPHMSAAIRCLVAGTVGKVHISEGQFVRAGDPLVSLDDRLVRAQVHIAEIQADKTGELNRAETQLSLAERQLSRLEAAFDRKGISEFELEEQRARLDQARAIHQTQLEAKRLAEANRMLAVEQLRRLTVFAPFDGVVTELHTKLGASVDPSLPVVSVANLDTLEIELHAPVRFYGSIRAGGQVKLLASAPVRETIVADVMFASPILNSASNTFRCVLRVDNDGQKLPAGFSVTLSSPYPAVPSLQVSQK